MPSTKLRALKTDEEIKAIPIDQPVMIELPAPPTNEAPAGGEGAAQAAEKTQTEAEQQPDFKTLQAQLEAMKAANQQRDAREAQLARERDEAREAARRAEQNAGDAQQQQATSGLAQAQANMAAAKQAYKIASEGGDFAAAADAQEKIGRAAADIRHYETVAAELGQRKTDQQQQQQNRPVEQTDMLANMRASPNLLPQEKTWFDQHPEALIDRRMNIRLEDGYNRAIEKGLIRGTPDYFKFIDQHMGYAKVEPEPSQADLDTEDISVMAAAPVTRGSQSMTNGNSRPDQVVLSADERELCANMGISEVAYAQQKVKMAQDKKARPEAYYIQSGR